MDTEAWGETVEVVFGKSFEITKQNNARVTLSGKLNKTMRDRQNRPQYQNLSCLHDHRKLCRTLATCCPSFEAHNMLGPAGLRGVVVWGLCRC